MWEDIARVLGGLDPDEATSYWPLSEYGFEPPEDEDVSSTLPCPEALRQLYRALGGGTLGPDPFTLIPVSQLVEQNRHWRRELEGMTPVAGGGLAERYLVFALDAGGEPVIWDEGTGEVGVLTIVSATWESQAESIEDWLEDLFDEEVHEGTDWGEALTQAGSLATGEEDDDEVDRSEDELDDLFDGYDDDDDS